MNADNETYTMYQARAILAENIRAGAELLDREKPRWAHRINTECLQLNNIHHCILGQLYGPGRGEHNGFEQGLRALQHVLPEEPERGAAYGLALPEELVRCFGDKEVDNLWAHMDDLWTEQVRRRLA